MTESTDNDLSPYELARLERIKRNEERLRNLGLIGNKFKSLLPAPAAKKVVKKPPRKRVQRAPSVPTRSSKRLRELKDGIKILESVEESVSEEDIIDTSPEPVPEVNYGTMPKEPEYLDDHEFQVYVSLRAWRLYRKNELEVEPYKICQNRTLCELIRRRRNDSNFAYCKVSPGCADSSVGGIEIEATIEKDLLSVWGIGPSKAEKGGFGWEMLEVLGNEENTKFLELSRGDKTGNNKSLDNN